MEDLLQGGAPDDGKLRQIEEAVHHPVVELVRVGRQVLLHSETQYSSSSSSSLSLSSASFPRIYILL